MRLCVVDGRVGYFHCLEHYSRPVEASPLIGGPPAGIISRVNGVVEFSEGSFERVPLIKIRFIDLRDAQRAYDELKSKEK